MNATPEIIATKKHNSKLLLTWLDFFNSKNARVGLSIAEYKDGHFEIVSTADNKRTAEILQRVAADLLKQQPIKHDFKKPN